MPATLDALSKEALNLPPDQRVVLAWRLLESVELDPDLSTEAGWEAEIAGRIARFDAGESRGIPAGEVFARLSQTALLSKRALARDWDRPEEAAAWNSL